MNDNTPLPDYLLKMEGYIRQYCELKKIENELGPLLRIDSTEETSTHMDVRIATEKEINSRKDYISCCITEYIADLFISHGILSKYPELRTSRNGK